MKCSLQVEDDLLKGLWETLQPIIEAVVTWGWNWITKFWNRGEVIVQMLQASFNFCDLLYLGVFLGRAFATIYFIYKCLRVLTKLNKDIEVERRDYVVLCLNLVLMVGLSGVMVVGWQVHPLWAPVPALVEDLLEIILE